MGTTAPHVVRPEVDQALRACRPVVALESTLIAHGLPQPLNLETARAAEAVVREEGGVPATIAVIAGRPTIGLTADELLELSQRKDILKASRRDLAQAVASKSWAATTVAATIFLAHRAGIRFFATGGIGGAHRGPGFTWDISADLVELSRTPVAVVCAGAKSLLDLSRTLEILETLGVPVIGFRTDDFPAFYARSSGLRTSGRVETFEEAAQLCKIHWEFDGNALVLAQPVAEDVALTPEEIETAIAMAEQQAAAAGIRGSELTPYLLARLAEATDGRSLRANQALIVANARLTARIAAAYERSQ